MRMASSEFSKEQLNYFRICYITTDLIPECLRTIFKQEWDNRHKTTVGEWKDTPKNGGDFYNGESVLNRNRNARLLATMTAGNRAEWDCTMLFYAILYSDCIHGLSPIIRTNVDDLRKFRNEDFAHMPRGELTDVQFQKAVQKVIVAFQNLAIDIKPIQDISKQKSFPTKELEGVMQKVRDLKDELKASEQKRYWFVTAFSMDFLVALLAVVAFYVFPVETSFVVLPLPPSHGISKRVNEVSAITEQLHKLRDTNKGKLTSLYISGNPGSGKSQLARQVGERLSSEATNDTGTLSFVMTINAATMQTLLETYVEFALRLQCSEYSITNTIASRDMKTEEKIRYLKSLVALKVRTKSWWLLIVDNVANLSSIHALLPQTGTDEWAGGQLLITTQDSSSIPPHCSFTSHFSITKGMEEVDAASLLASLSGINDTEMVATVVKALDYQPLALASAATYVKLARESKVSPNFSWNNFLPKLVDEEKRQLIEDNFSKSNPTYPISMIAANSLAVKSTLDSDKVFKYAFQFLSFCSYEPLQLNIVINYILILDKQQDRELVGIKIRSCSLVVVEDREHGVYVRLHQVVHQVVKNTFKENNEGRLTVNADAVITSIIKCVRERLPQTSLNDKFYVDSQPFVPHLKALLVSMKKRFPGVKTLLLVETKKRVDVSSSFRVFGLICYCHSQFQSAKDFVMAALFLLVDKEDHDKFYMSNETRYVGTHKDVAIAYSYMGLVHKGLGELQEAQQCHERSLSILQNQLGHEHIAIDIVSEYSNLGAVHYALGDFQTAKQYHELQFAILTKLASHKKQLGDELIDFTDTFNSLGSVYLALGNLQQAKHFFLQALDLSRNKTGNESIGIAATYSSLGLVYRALGDLKQAKKESRNSSCDPAEISRTSTR